MAKISLTMDLLIPVIAFIDGISLGVTENPFVNRIAKGSLFLVFVYLVCSYLLKEQERIILLAID